MSCVPLHPEHPEGDATAPPTDLEGEELTASLSKKPKEEVRVTVRGYHGDGILTMSLLL